MNPHFLTPAHNGELYEMPMWEFLFVTYWICCLFSAIPDFACDERPDPENGSGCQKGTSSKKLLAVFTLFAVGKTLARRGDVFLLIAILKPLTSLNVLLTYVLNVKL